MAKPKKPPATIDEQLRAAIEARGLAGSELARMAEVDHRVVNRWLAGTRDLKLSTACKLATALGLRLR